MSDTSLTDSESVFKHFDAEPAICVLCIASKEAGYLHGKWIDATLSAEEIHAAISALRACSPVAATKGYELHETKGFGSLQIDQAMSIQLIADLAAFITEYGQLGAAILDETNCNIDEATTLITEHYYSDYRNTVEFAEYYLEDTRSDNIPAWLAPYIDYEKLAYDLFITDFFEIRLDGRTHVFSHL